MMTLRNSKTLLAALTLTMLTLTAQAKDQMPWDNGKLTVSANHLFLQFENGKPFFWLGDTGWLMPERLNRDEVAYYLQQCRRAGYNMVQVQVINAVPSYNVYGQSSHPYGWDLSKADPEGCYSYWDHLDYIIRTAQKNGIYIGLVPIWGTLVQHGDINVEQAKAYGSFLANRYKDRPNVIWIIGGDIVGSIHPEIWNTLATSIKAIVGSHLMSYHPRGRYTSAKWWSKAPWLDFHMFQSGHRRYGQHMGNKDYPIPDSTEEDNWMYVDSTWKYKPIKPVLDDEPSYENIPKGLHDPNEPRWQAEDVRRYAYWSVFAGSCGHTYGHNSIMQMIKPGTATGYGSDGKEKYWYEALDDSGFNQMKYLKDLMLTFPYFERVPDQTIIAGNNGRRYERLIATRGNSYLMVYNYTGRDMSVDLSKITGKKKNVWWFDPSNGHLDYLGVFSNGVQRFTAPVAHDGNIHDGVLIAVDTACKYLAENQRSITGRGIADQQRNLNE